MNKEIIARRRIAIKTIRCVELLSSFLDTYESGELNMYIPMSSQLRILICDTLRRRDNSLLGRLVPDIKLRAFCKIEPIGPHGGLSLMSMPFTIQKLPSGVPIADFDLSNPPAFISLSEWREQSVTLMPHELKVAQIIRSVCDKGGGAHVDDEDGPDLGAMQKSGPLKIGLHVPFIVAASRYALGVGNSVLLKQKSALKLPVWNARVRPPLPSMQWKVVQSDKRKTLD